MIDLSFEINGRKVNPNQLSNALEKAVVQQLSDKLKRSIGSVRDPKTGKHPKVTVKGRDLSNLSFEIEGSEEVIEEVKRRISRL
jgi:actin-like ATPase involved in cell morphogenesis